MSKRLAETQLENPRRAWAQDFVRNRRWQGTWSPSGQPEYLLAWPLSPFPPKPSRKALSGLEVRLSMGDITRSISSGEEVRHDRTSRSHALRSGPPGAPAPGGSQHSTRGFTETRGPCPPPGHPPHTLLCPCPPSRGARGRNHGGSSSAARWARSPPVSFAWTAQNRD